MTVTRHASLCVLALVFALLLGGCETPGRRMLPVAAGEVVVRERLAVTPAQPWNQFEGASGAKLALWTKEGLPLDQLTFYVGIADGEPLLPQPADAKVKLPPFRASMPIPEVVDLLQGAWARGGAQVTVERVEGKPFGGQPGFRLEYGYVRGTSPLRMRGIAWGGVIGKELFVIDWMAPQLVFFERYAAEVDALAATARLVR